MSQLEEQGGEEGGVEVVVDFKSRSLEFLRRKMLLHHVEEDLPLSDSLRHIRISSGTRPQTPTSFYEMENRMLDAIQKYYQSLANLSFSDLKGEEVGVEVESESQIPVSHHYYSMEEQFPLYGNFPCSYFFEYRYRNVPEETPPSPPLFSKILDPGRHSYTALVRKWENYILPSSLMKELLDRSGEVHPLYEGVRKSRWRAGEWEARVRGRNGRSGLSLGTFGTPEDAARAHDRAAFRIWGRRARLNFCEFSASGHPIPAAHISGCSAYPEEIIKDDHLTIQIHQLEDEETTPPPTHVVQGLWAKIKTTFGEKAMNAINRSTQGISHELPVGLIGLTYQFMSMPWAKGNTRYILTVANALGFLFLLLGIIRRARKCRCANLLLFMGTLFSSGGIIFSMSRDVHGLLGWFVPMTCLLVVMTAFFF